MIPEEDIVEEEMEESIEDEEEKQRLDFFRFQEMTNINKERQYHRVGISDVWLR